MNEDEEPVQYAINCALCGMDIIFKVCVEELFANCKLSAKFVPLSCKISVSVLFYTEAEMLCLLTYMPRNFGDGIVL